MKELVIVLQIPGMFNLRGVHAPNFQKHDFEIMVDPKGSSNEATFWSSFEGPDP